VERLRQILAAEFLLLQTLPNALERANTLNEVTEDGDPTAFDNLDDEPEVPEPVSEPRTRARLRSDPNHIELIPPERQPVILPSTHFPSDHPLCSMELTIRKKQVTRYLAAIREAVAEKSFQYTHVMRKTSSKAVRTRSRGIIAKLNVRIASYCKVYGRARLALVRLGADDKTLSTFQILTKEDVKASSAIRNPNDFGSSSIRLSWIWQTEKGLDGPESESESDPAMMCECGFDPVQLLVS
jgi:hypothetical protein